MKNYGDCEETAMMNGAKAAPRATSSTSRVKVLLAAIGSAVVVGSAMVAYSTMTTRSETASVLRTTDLAEAVAQDCQLSDWSPWDRTCDGSGGIKTRSKSILVKGTEGGKLCPQDCVVSDWSAWNRVCDKSGGMRTRTRSVLTAAVNGGMCAVPLTESRSCNYMAQYVLVKRTDNRAEYINLLKIDVYDADGNLIPASTIKPSLYPQYGDVATFGPQHLLDGSWLTHCTNDPNAYVQFDLGAEKAISKVVVTNRVDCCQARIVGTSVVLKNSNKLVVYQRPITTVDGVYVMDLWAAASNDVVNPPVGTPYSGPVSEAVACSADCVFSEWGSWDNKCDAASGGVRTHSRSIVSPGSNDGLSCEGALVESRSCVHTAQYVTLARTDNRAEYINIQQIIVYDADGKPIPASAIKASLWPQYGDVATFGPQHVLDGTFLAHCSNDPKAFIQLDLGAERAISKVYILNRVDCCQERIVGTSVQLKNANGDVVFQHTITDVDPKNYLIDLGTAPTSEFKRPIVGNFVSTFTGSSP